SYRRQLKTHNPNTGGTEMINSHTHRTKFLALALLVTLVLSGVMGCGGKSVEPYAPQMQEVRVPEDGLPPASRLADRSDPEDVLKFAAGLVKDGRYSDAAQQYMNLAKGVYEPQPDGETVYLLAMEAARLYFVAGKTASSSQEAVDNIRNLSECTELARNATSLSERVISAEEAVLLYLGDTAKGRSAQSYWTKVPRQLVAWVNSAQSQIGG
ncbi:hypothetical protein ACFL6S_24965, partial [Candidatus Poribacteria bacterium]